jgi:hypothetical protein
VQHRLLVDRQRHLPGERLPDGDEPSEGHHEREHHQRCRLDAGGVFDLRCRLRLGLDDRAFALRYDATHTALERCQVPLTAGEPDLEDVVEGPTSSRCRA